MLPDFHNDELVLGHDIGRFTEEKSHVVKNHISSMIMHTTIPRPDECKIKNHSSSSSSSSPPASRQ